MSGNVLKTREVRSLRGLLMQVDVEGADVEEGQIEVLRGWEVDVRQQALGRDFFRVLIEMVKEALDPKPAVPPNDVGWYLVADRKHQDCRVVRKLAHCVADPAPDLSLQSTIVQERDVLRPREAHHHVQAPPGRLVEEVAIGERVEPDRVDAKLGHRPEVVRHCRQGRELDAPGVGRECPVGDTFHEETIAAQT